MAFATGICPKAGSLKQLSLPQLPSGERGVEGPYPERGDAGIGEDWRADEPTRQIGGPGHVEQDVYARKPHPEADQSKAHSREGDTTVDERPSHGIDIGIIAPHHLLCSPYRDKKSTKKNVRVPRISSGTSFKIRPST